MEYLWIVICDEQIIFVSPNVNDCIDYQIAFYRNTGEQSEIEQYYYKNKLNWYLEE